MGTAAPLIVMLSPANSYGKVLVADKAANIVSLLNGDCPTFPHAEPRLCGARDATAFSTYPALTGPITTSGLALTAAAWAAVAVVTIPYSIRSSVMARSAINRLT